MHAYDFIAISSSTQFGSKKPENFHEKKIKLENLA